MKTRYPGAQPFSTEQRPIFFGREQELDELRRFVQAEQLVVLYAKSGLGKSSLLNAGLIPLVEEEGRLQALSVRFGAHTEGSEATPLGNAIAGIRMGAGGLDKALEKIKPAGENSLWYHLKSRHLASSPKGYLLVFDQFEELFTYPDAALQAFGKELSEILYTTIPDRFRVKMEVGLKTDPAFLSAEDLQRLHQPFELRVIMAIRSDRMSLMNKLKAFLPNILENCYELRSLTVQEAESAILSPAYLPQETGPFLSPMFDYEDEAVASLIDFLSEGRTQEIESFQLQILCEYVERQVVIKQGKTLAARADVSNPGLILENYYLGKIEDLPEADRLPARRLIEEGLVFEEEERRLSLYEGQITRSYSIGPGLLRALLDTHLVRSEPSLRGGYTYELSHDTLVAPVLKAKNKRLEVERLEAESEAQRRKEEEMATLREKAERERLRAEEEKLLRDKAQSALADLEKAMVALRANNETIFASFANLGTDLIYTLDHEAALEKMKVAVEIEVDADIKKQRLVEPISELLYFFAESGRRFALAWDAAELLQRLAPDSEFSPILLQCLREGWTTRQQFAPLLSQFSCFSKFQTRYYPELVNITLGEEGIFEMGSKPDEWGRKDDEKLHPVKLSPYQIAATPVTFYQFALFSEATGRGLASRAPYWGRFGDHPVVNVNWYEAVEYAIWLNKQQGLASVYSIQRESSSDLNNRMQYDYLKWKVRWDKSAKGYRLPSEAEWELAARGGALAPRHLFAGSDIMDKVGWCWENSGDKPLLGDWDLNKIFDNNGRTRSVKLKKDNGAGIYDMSGNVWEWCWDWYDAEYYERFKDMGVADNPCGADHSTDGRIVRGGAWLNRVSSCRVANRFYLSPDLRGNDRNGFRVVFVP